MRKLLLSILFLICVGTITGQNQVIQLHEMAELSQVYGETEESEELVSMNDLGIEFGYILYAVEVEIAEERTYTLKIDNIRDYVAVYVDDTYRGSLTDNNKNLPLELTKGKHSIKLYSENIGRITYGPEILDNSKGLWGNAFLDNIRLSKWKITPLKIREYQIEDMVFEELSEARFPAFLRGSFIIDKIETVYLDTSGWGMGEVWINGQYVGAYWEEEALQSVPIPASTLRRGANEVVVFELKNNYRETIKVVAEPVFK